MIFIKITKVITNNRKNTPEHERTGGSKTPYKT